MKVEGELHAAQNGRKRWMMPKPSLWPLLTVGRNWGPNWSWSRSTMCLSGIGCCLGHQLRGTGVSNPDGPDGKRAGLWAGLVRIEQWRTRDNASSGQK